MDTATCQQAFEGLLIRVTDRGVQYPVKAAVEHSDTSTDIGKVRNERPCVADELQSTTNLMRQP